MDAITISFTCYLGIILFIGIYTSKITKNIKDFALGGQKLGPTIIAFSERASSESAWLILGLPGAALVLGLVEIWTVIGCIGGIFLSWMIIAHPLRLETEKYNVITLPEYFEKKFNDESGLLSLFASSIITFFFTFYVAAQFSGAGKVLNVTFNIPPTQGMFYGAIIIIFYTFLGGFLAVALTDLIQGIIMIGALIILPIVGFIELSQMSDIQLIDLSSLYGGKTNSAALIASIGGLSWGLGYIGQPHLISRYMAIDKAENIYISRRIAYCWAIPAFFGAMFIGLIGSELIENQLLRFNGNLINTIDQLNDPENLMPLMAKNLLPGWLSGIIISGAIAAMMSTADSQLLISTTVLTKDIIYKFFRKKEHNLLFFTRFFTVIIGSIALFMAWRSEKLVIETVSYAWGGLGSSFGPALALSLWWEHTKKEGVFVGFFCGTVFTMFPLFSESITPRLSAFIISFIAIIIVSKLKK